MSSRDRNFQGPFDLGKVEFVVHHQGKHLSQVDFKRRNSGLPFQEIRRLPQIALREDGEFCNFGCLGGIFDLNNLQTRSVVLWPLEHDSLPVVNSLRTLRK
jgi:hypothetical protein